MCPCVLSAFPGTGHPSVLGAWHLTVSSLATLMITLRGWCTVLISSQATLRCGGLAQEAISFSAGTMTLSTESESLHESGLSRERT